MSAFRPRRAHRYGVTPHLIDKYNRCESDDLARFARSRLPATLVNGAPSLAGRSLGFLCWYNTRKAPFGAFLTIYTNPLPENTPQDSTCEVEDCNGVILAGSPAKAACDACAFSAANLAARRDGIRSRAEATRASKVAISTKSLSRGISTEGESNASSAYCSFSNGSDSPSFTPG